jgi:hypothetical protein
MMLMVLCVSSDEDAAEPVGGPFSILLRSVLEQLQERDQSNIFAHPVSIKEVTLTYHG